MAADTATKRLSAMDPMCPWRRALPLPDGTLDAPDRAQALFLYARIAALPPMLPVGICPIALDMQLAPGVILVMDSTTRAIALTMEVCE